MGSIISRLFAENVFQPPEKSLVLFWLWTLGRGSGTHRNRPRIPRLRRRRDLRSVVGPVVRNDRRHGLRRRLPSRHLRPPAAVETARFHRLRARDENLIANPGAGRRRQPPVSASICTVTIPSGASKLCDVAIFAMLVRALHEFQPDRQSAVRAFQLEIAIVVESHPHHTDQLGGEPRKPSVARRAGFPRRRQRESAARAPPLPCPTAALPPSCSPPDTPRADRSPASAAAAHW